MFSRTILSAACAFALGGCATPPSPTQFGVNSPANPNAMEAPPRPASPTLAMDIAGQPLGSDSAGRDMKQDTGAMDPSMPGMKHGPGGMQGDMPGMQHGPGPTTSQPTTTAAMFTCVMHPEVVSAQPGKCPKCGMKLVPKKDAKGDPHAGHSHQGVSE